MLTITKKTENETITFTLEGRLDTSTATDLENEIKDSLSGINELIFDFEKLDYISSSGLRVLLLAQKIMLKQGNMRIINVNDDVKEIFELTGFSDIMDIK